MTVADPGYISHAALTLLVARQEGKDLHHVSTKVSFQDRQRKKPMWNQLTQIQPETTTRRTTRLTALYPGQPVWAGTRTNIRSLTSCHCGYYTTSLTDFLHFYSLQHLRCIFVKSDQWPSFSTTSILENGHVNGHANSGRHHQSPESLFDLILSSLTHMH